ncbi:MAG: SbcC/MukB-like Walker B domain-containing protein [Pseudomonadota bacterium]|nr:SbcC/MukB-like Walker B domain-containing protein [Pseudomonadota bacterium]
MDELGNQLFGGVAARGEAGNKARFGGRWRLVSAGLSNVWRFGNLELPASSGRLLLRGQNGTGKTTALEALWPYLLDLNAARLAAGKARSTSLLSLMREGAEGKRRTGYVWVTFTGPEGDGTVSFGVRLQYSEGGSPPVKVVPFTVPGRPLHELPLASPSRAALSAEQFTSAVQAIGGQTFDDDDAYVAHLSATVLRTTLTSEVVALASRLRSVRNPSLLGDVSPQAAAQALRDSLPTVSDDVITATADALAESDTTREAFERDAEAGTKLADFLAAWTGHATDVLQGACNAASEAAQNITRLRAEQQRKSSEHADAVGKAAAAKQAVEVLEEKERQGGTKIRTLQDSPAYRESGRLGDLQDKSTALSTAASASRHLLEERASSSFQRAIDLLQDAQEVLSEFGGCVAEAAREDPALGQQEVVLEVREEPRSVVILGQGQPIVPGPRILLTGTAADVTGVLARWTVVTRQHRQLADLAGLALANLKPVEKAELAATEARRAAGERSRDADAADKRARELEAEVGRAAAALLEAVAVWSVQNTDLASPDEENDELPRWDSDEIRALAGREVAEALTLLADFASAASRRGEQVSATWRSVAKGLQEHAKSARTDAKARRATASDLRAGRLLPLPRPGWAGLGDDASSLGATLDWRNGVIGEKERDRIEVALANSGLLGALLETEGAATPCWQVRPWGSAKKPNLLDVLQVDEHHPLHAVATAVLERVQLLDRVRAPGAETLGHEDGALVLGRDGSFRAGVLAGDNPHTASGRTPPKATHVGARQRREAALQQAATLEAEADELEAEASRLEGRAATLVRDAGVIAQRAQGFPRRDALSRSEIERASAAKAALAARDLAKLEEIRATSVAEAARAARLDWAARTQEMGLPPDPAALTTTQASGRVTADRIEGAAKRASRLTERWTRLCDRARGGPAAEEDLVRAEANARTAHGLAVDAAEALRVLEETAGEAIADVLARVDAAKKELASVQENLGPARKRMFDLAGDEVQARGALDDVGRRHAAATPLAARAEARVRMLLAAPGVVDGVFGGVLPPDGADSIRSLSEAVARKRTLTRKTLRERADETRAALAGIWSLDPAEDIDELLMYVLTHRDATYTPPQAASHAADLRERAKRALAASEARALQEFVIGRLPSAIGAAWTRLNDWKRAVNQKMKAASASSGVGVQVQVELREDLSAHERTLYRLCCIKSDADRLPEQQREVGESVQALVDSSEAEGMREKLASAVDIRAWVNIHYEVTRPGGKSQRWNSRTGLSGGERRLVVIAPMLAAIAASYDRFGPQGLRLVALDEVPTEVDDRGREGLARYIAELDLDLCCTSHLWEGCPGAWDGIDAFDLEAGPDGTVVGFPMLVRGLLDIPEPEGVG